MPQQRILTEETIAELPLYAPLNTWCEALQLTPPVLYTAIKHGLLEGDKPGYRSYYFTRKQILRWYAPSLYEEIYEDDLTRVKMAEVEGNE